MQIVPVEISDEHYHICKVWLEDKDITKWLSSTLRFGRYHKIIHKMLISERKNMLFFISINDKPVGLIGFRNIDRVDKRAEVWYLIGSKSYMGQNIATEALALVKEVAIKEIQIVSFYALVAEPNIASIRVLEKNDFKYVGKFRNAFFVDGSYKDFLIFDWVSN